MQKIIPTNVNEKSHGNALNALAVTKRAYPIYFATDTSITIKNADANAITASGKLVVASANISAYVSDGSYIKIGDEVIKVLDIAADNITMLIERGQFKTTPASHAKASKIYIYRDHLTKVEMNGADDPIPESQVVADLEDSSLYDISLGIKVLNVTDDNSGAIITLYYAFSNNDDIPLTDAGATALALSKTTAKAITLPNGTLNLYYVTDTIKPLARYIYIWAKSDAAVVQTNSCDYYLTINTV